MGKYGKKADQRVPFGGLEPSETDFAYFAGILDGEGSFDVSNHRNPRIKVAMTDGPTIAWLEDTFGGRVQVENPSGSAKLVAWKWYLLQRADVRDILERAMPYLITKRDRAKAVLDALEYLSHANNSSHKDPTWNFGLQDLLEPVYARSWKQRLYESTAPEGVKAE